MNTNIKLVIGKILPWVIAIIYLQTLYFKFSAHPDSVYIFTKLGLEPYGRIGIGIMELITAILILLPQTRIIGAILSLGVIAGAVFAHLGPLGIDVRGDGGKVFYLALVVLFATIIYLLLNLKSVFELINRLLNKNKMKKELMMVCLMGIFWNACAQKQSKPVSTEKADTAIAATDWKAKLTPEQYYVLREKGTEKPYTGEFLFTKEKGVYKCAGCGNELFTDEMKFDSHCGWPSFDREVKGGKIIQTVDRSAGMERIEITCAKCGGHLGHIFDDGPTETGQRYCVNSASLSFEPSGSQPISKTDTITLAGGCFWCIEALFEDLKGVSKVESGYSGGNTVDPTYTEVSGGQTGHAEAVNLIYEPSIISLEELLEVFFALHDPTTLNQQGYDIGPQYRSAIFYHNAKQKQAAEKIIATLNMEKAFDSPIVTEVTAFKKFYVAENYHQEYYAINKNEPYCRNVIKPKVDKLHKIFKDKIKP